MKEVSWASLSNKSHYEKLAKLLTAKEIPQVSSCLEVTEGDFVSTIKGLMEKVTSIRIDEPYCGRLSDLLVQFPFEMSFLNFADHLIKKDGKWWLRSLLNEAIRRSLVTSGVPYEVTGNALVIGDGASARAGVYGLSSLGVRTLEVVGSSIAASQDIIKHLEHHCFKVKFSAIDQDAIKDLPPKYTIILNTSPVSTANTCLVEASYFNFILPGAIVMDLSPDNDANFFLKEAKKLSAHCIAGEKVQGMKDIIWAEEVFNFALNINEISSI